MARTVGGSAATICSAGNGWNSRMRSMPTRLAGGDQRVDGLLDRAAGGAHDDDDALGVRRAVVVDQPVAAAGPRRELVHDLLDDAGHGQVERVGRLAGLEEDVGVLGRAAHDRARPGVRPRPRKARTSSSRTSARMSSSSSSAILSISCEVRKPSKKWRNGTRAAERGGVGHEREVVGLLHRAGGEHRPARRAGVHHVAVVAEDRQGVRGDRCAPRRG